MARYEELNRVLVNSLNVRWHETARKKVQFSSVVWKCDSFNLALSKRTVYSVYDTITNNKIKLSDYIREQLTRLVRYFTQLCSNRNEREKSFQSARNKDTLNQKSIISDFNLSNRFVSYRSIRRRLPSLYDFSVTVKRPFIINTSVSSSSNITFIVVIDYTRIYQC